MREKSSVLSIMAISLLMLSSLMIPVQDETDHTSNKAVSLEYSLTSDTVVIFADDFEHDAYVPAPYGDYPGNVGTLYPSGFTQGMSVGDDAYLHNYSRDCWGVSSYRSHSGINSLWCAQYGRASWGYGDSVQNSDIHRVDQEMFSYYENYLDNLSEYDDLTLSFWYWQETSAPLGTYPGNEPGSWYADLLSLKIFNGTAWWNATTSAYYWTHFGNQTTWTQVVINLPSCTKLWGFYYDHLGVSNRTLYEGAYIDDIVLTGHKKPQSSILIGDSYLFNFLVRPPSVGPNHFTLTTNASWLSISSSNATAATISGTPTRQGVYSVSLKANDSVSVTWRNWTVKVYDTLEFDFPLAAASVPFGNQYWFNISIQQNIYAKPNMFKLITNASWLTISWQNDTQINVSGIPSVSGIFNVSLIVNNSYSTAWKNWTITVGPPPPISKWWYVVITGVIGAVVLLLFVLRWRGMKKVRALRKSSLNHRSLPSLDDQKAKKPRKGV